MDLSFLDAPVWAEEPGTCFAEEDPDEICGAEGDPAEKAIRVVMVRPGERAVVTELSAALPDYQEAVGGCIEAFYPFEEEVCIVCNEEGKLNGMEPCRAVYDGGEIVDIVFGPFFICSCAGEDFSGLDQEQAERYQELFALPETFFHLGGRLRAVPYEPEELI